MTIAATTSPVPNNARPVQVTVLLLPPLHELLHLVQGLKQHLLPGQQLVQRDPPDSGHKPPGRQLVTLLPVLLGQLLR